MVIETATAGDLPEIRQVLAKCGISDGALSLSSESIWKVVRAGNCIVGAMGLLCRETGAVLHSVAVVPGFRGLGIGHRLVQSSLDWSARQTLDAIYLFTNRAEFFFRSMGFQVLEEFEAPVPVLQELGYCREISTRAAGHLLFFDLSSMQKRTIAPLLRPVLPVLAAVS